MARTEFFVRKQSGGMFVASNLTEHPNELFFVDSGSSTGADESGYGKNPDAPFLTLAYALSSDVCAASKGDIIYVMPAHAETVDSAGDITLDIAGVTVIGLGRGENRPVITFTTGAAASIIISADDCAFLNIVMKCNIANQNHMIDLSGDNVEIGYCAFLEGTATGLSFITADTADADSDHAYIHHNEFLNPTAANMDNAIQLAKDFSNVRIEDNIISGDFDVSAIDVPAGGNACVNLRIKRNEITNTQTGKYAIQINSTAVTGMIGANWTETDTQANTIDSAACSRFGNLWCDVDGSNDEEGIPVDAFIAGSELATIDSNVDAVLVDTGTTLPATLGTPADTDLATDIANSVTAVGTCIIVTKTITSSDINDDGGGTPLASPLTGAASGDLMLEEIIFQTDSATGLAGPTAVQVVCDNVDGLTGATVPLWDEAVASLGAAKMINNTSADVNLLPIMLESTKKLYITGDDGDGTGAGTVEVIMKFRRVTAGATIAAAA